MPRRDPDGHKGTFGKVYLLGMVRSQKDADRAVAHARATNGVTGVISLLIPPMAKK